MINNIIKNIRKMDTTYIRYNKRGKTSDFLSYKNHWINPTKPSIFNRCRNYC